MKVDSNGWCKYARGLFKLKGGRKIVVVGEGRRLEYKKVLNARVGMPLRLVMPFYGVADSRLFTYGYEVRLDKGNVVCRISSILPNGRMWLVFHPDNRKMFRELIVDTRLCMTGGTRVRSWAVGKEERVGDGGGNDRGSGRGSDKSVEGDEREDEAGEKVDEGEVVSERDLEDNGEDEAGSNRKILDKDSEVGEMLARYQMSGTPEPYKTWNIFPISIGFDFDKE